MALASLLCWELGSHLETRILSYHSSTEKATFWNVYDLISSVEKHNVHDGVLTGFKYTNVNSNYVYSSCDLRMAEKIMTPIIRVKIRLSSLLEMKHGNIIKLR